MCISQQKFSFRECAVFSMQLDVYNVMLLLFCTFLPHSRCVACADGFYGPGCEHQCQCLNAGVCLSVSGACECPAGFIGARCNLSESLHSKHTLHLIDSTLSAAQSSPLQRVQPDGTGRTVPMWPSVERGRETIQLQADVSEMTVSKVSWCFVCCLTCLRVSLMDVCVCSLSSRLVWIRVFSAL